MPIPVGPEKDPRRNNVVALPQRKRLADPDEDAEDGDDEDDEDGSDAPDPERRSQAEAEDQAEDESLDKDDEEGEEEGQAPYIIFSSFPAMVAATVNKAATHYRYCHPRCNQRHRYREGGRLFSIEEDPDSGQFPNAVDGDWMVHLFSAQPTRKGRPPQYVRCPWDPRNAELRVIVRIGAPRSKPLPQPTRAKNDSPMLTAGPSGFIGPTSSLGPGQSQQMISGQIPNASTFVEILKAFPITQHSQQLTDALFKLLAQVSARDELTLKHAEEARARAAKAEAALEKLQAKQSNIGLLELIRDLFESNPEALTAFIGQLFPAVTLLLAKIKVSGKQQDSE